MASVERKQLVEVVAESCRVLGKLDLTHGALGHVSYRIEGSDSMLIKGKGPDEVGLRFTEPDDILEVDFDAEKVSGPDGLQPPSESFLHIGIYRARPEVRCVIHMHPVHAVLLTATNKEIRPIYGAFSPAGAQLAIEGVPTYGRSVRISDEVLGAEFASFLGQHSAGLMRGHGVTVAGSGVEEASVRIIELNRLLTVLYQAYLIGDPQPISDEDLEELRRPRDENRRRGSAGGDAGTLATWRYWCAFTGERAT